MADDPRLFGSKRPKKPREWLFKEPDPFAGHIQQLVRLYCRLYRLRNGERPQLVPLDVVTLKRKLKLCYDPNVENAVDVAVAKVAARLTFFMQRDDEYVRTHGGFTMATFDRQWNAIVNLLNTQGSQIVQCHHLPKCQSEAEHTRKAIDERRTSPNQSPGPLKPNGVF